MRLPEAKKLVRKWQTILGLEAWSITTRWSYKDEDYAELYGTCIWSTEESTATIVLNKLLVDEHTIIHELLHLLIEGHQHEDTSYDALYERALNILSQRLLEGRE